MRRKEIKMTRNRLEDLLARPYKDFNEQYTGHCADIISHIHAQPGSPEWADAVCQEYGAANERYKKNQALVAVCEERIKHSREDCEAELYRDRIQRLRAQMKVDFDYILLFEEGELELDDMERFLVGGIYKDHKTWTELFHPNTGKKMSNNAISKLKESALDKLSDAMVDYYLWLLARRAA